MYADGILLLAEMVVFRLISRKLQVAFMSTIIYYSMI